MGKFDSAGQKLIMGVGETFSFAAVNHMDSFLAISESLPVDGMIIKEHLFIYANNVGGTDLYIFALLNEYLNADTRSYLAAYAATETKTKRLTEQFVDMVQGTNEWIVYLPDTYEPIIIQSHLQSGSIPVIQVTRTQRRKIQSGKRLSLELAAASDDSGTNLSGSVDILYLAEILVEDKTT